MIALKNKVVLITGASSGIGFELSNQLAKEGCRLALLARRDEILRDMVENLEGGKEKHIYVRCDVSNKKDVNSALSFVKEKFGKIDIAVLNSGTSYHSSIEKYDSEIAEKIFNVNVLGIIYFIEQLLPEFMKNKSGTIIGVSSLAESRGFPRSGFYCASKSAVSLLMESLRIESRKYGVKILTVKPGFVKTPMTDKNDFGMPFLMDVSKAVKIIIKGIKKEKEIIQFPAATVLGAKILKILPDSIFEYIAKRI